MNADKARRKTEKELARKNRGYARNIEWYFKQYLERAISNGYSSTIFPSDHNSELKRWYNETTYLAFINVLEGRGYRVTKEKSCFYEPKYKISWEEM